MSSAHLNAKPLTDYWRIPPSTDVSNAPTHLNSHISQGFRKARVTVSASWTRLYDQGGLLIHLPSPGDEKRRWIKAGIEFAGGRPNLSVVATRECADWSLHEFDGDSVTIQIEREPIDIEKGKGSSLSVYVLKDDKRADLPLRKVTWAFEQEGEIEVGIYAARPTKIDEHDDEELTVKFDDIRLDIDL